MPHRSRQRTRGFTLTELAIVLGIVAVLSLGLFNLISGANTQVRDQSAASQQSDLIASVKAYLATSEGQNSFLVGIGAGGKALPLPSAANPAATSGLALANCMADLAVASTDAGICGLLPPGFNVTTTNSYGQVYNIRILTDGTPAPNPPSSYSFMILTTSIAGATVPAISDTSGARISSLIGNDGGFVYASNVCGASANTMACGAYGAWNSTTGNYGFGVPGAPAYSGSIASRSYISPYQVLNNQFLARIVIPGNNAACPTAYSQNTMTTPEYLGGNALLMGSNLGAGLPPTASTTPPGNPTGTIYMGNYTGAPVAGTGGFLEMQGGTIDFAYNGIATGGGTMNMQAGVMNMQAGTINMGGGNIQDTSGLEQISLTTGGTPLTTRPLLQVGTSCSQDPGILLFGANSGLNGCTPGIQDTGDEFVTGRLNANSLYAQTFIYQTSDIRMKTNIHPLTNSMDDIMLLKPVSFVLKASGKESMGVIAQDVEKVYPQLVSERGDGMKAVNYDGLIAPLVDAVQKLKLENDDLKKQIAIQAEKQKQLEHEMQTRFPQGD